MFKKFVQEIVEILKHYFLIIRIRAHIFFICRIRIRSVTLVQANKYFYFGLGPVHHNPASYHQTPRQSHHKQQPPAPVEILAPAQTPAAPTKQTDRSAHLHNWVSVRYPNCIGPFSVCPHTLYQSFKGILLLFDA